MDWVVAVLGWNPTKRGSVQNMGHAMPNVGAFLEMVLRVSNMNIWNSIGGVSLGTPTKTEIGNVTFLSRWYEGRNLHYLAQSGPKYIPEIEFS